MLEPKNHFPLPPEVSVKADNLAGCFTVSGYEEFAAWAMANLSWFRTMHHEAEIRNLTEHQKMQMIVWFLADQNQRAGLEAIRRAGLTTVPVPLQQSR